MSVYRTIGPLVYFTFQITPTSSQPDVPVHVAVPDTVTSVPETVTNTAPAPDLVLSCGHPCIMCMEKYNISSQGLTNDHSYYKTPKPQLPVIEETPLVPLIKQDCSTPIDRKKLVGKTLKFFEETLNSDNIEEDMYDEDSMLNLSTVSNSFRDDSKDLTYVQDESDDNSGDEMDIEEKNDIVSQNKYICFEDCLTDLFVRLKCTQCDSPVDPDDIVEDSSDGTLLKCSVYCTGGHLIHSWSSQPLLGKMPAGNLLASAAILFCGQTYTHISQMASFFNLKFLSHTSYNNIQRQYVMPVIMYTWATLQDALLKNLKGSGKMLRLAGDGRCDSPGFSAKYCTYSILEMDSDAIVTFVVVQVSETGSSCRMEVEGFRRCMNYLLDLGFTVQVLATDRHVQIRSIMSKEYSSTDHQFDVWHLSNNIKKKLMQRAKAKGCEDLGLWIKAICNHLWWCSSNCNGNKDWLEECWKSVVHHVVNEHSFTGEHITQCPHEPLEPEVARKKKWLKKGSKAHNALKEVVLDKRLTKDIRHLSEFCHTGSLEVYHSLMTKYVPKRQEFDYDQMNARTALAVIDHNMSRDRIQLTNRKGEKMFKIVCTKANSQWVVKPRYESKKYDWVLAMMKKLVDEKQERTLSPVRVTKMGNIAPTPAPPKSQLIGSLLSRFSKKKSH